MMSVGGTRCQSALNQGVKTVELQLLIILLKNMLIIFLTFPKQDILL